MKLKATIPLRGDRIDYTFNPKSGVHTVWFAMTGAIYTATTPGVIANILAPYRGVRDVDELFTWLVK